MCSIKINAKGEKRYNQVFSFLIREIYFLILIKSQLIENKLLIFLPTNMP